MAGLTRYSCFLLFFLSPSFFSHPLLNWQIFDKGFKESSNAIKTLKALQLWIQSNLCKASVIFRQVLLILPNSWYRVFIQTQLCICNAEGLHVSTAPAHSRLIFGTSSAMKCFHVSYGHVCMRSSCSDITPFWSLFPSFICRNHPFLLQRFWQTLRGCTRWEWLRRRLKAQPIWTLFPTLPFLNHHLMSTANVPYLPYTCPHFCLLPYTITTAAATISLPLSTFFFTVLGYISRQDEVIVSLTPIEVKTAQGGRQSLPKRWFVPKRMMKYMCVGVVGFGWGGGAQSKMTQKTPVEVNPQIMGCICLIFGRFKGRKW